MCIFGKKTVTRVDRLGTCQNCGTDYLIFIKVAFRGFRPAYAIALVGKSNMQSISVSF